jgi:glucokinase
VPQCNCGLAGDVESFASLTGIRKNLLPYWLTRFPGHELASMPLDAAAKKVRSLAEAEDPLALAIFGQQAVALGRIFTTAGAFTDPSAYFVGGGVVETSVRFREWFLQRVRDNTLLHDEQKAIAQFALVPELDMAGARGSALAAAAYVQAL